MPPHRQRQRAIKRAAIEQAVSQMARKAAADRALAGAAGAIDSNNRCFAPHAQKGSEIFRPAPVASAAKPGNEVATFAQSLMTISPSATAPATANAMAIR